jgi:hypothetical protein
MLREHIRKFRLGILQASLVTVSFGRFVGRGPYLRKDQLLQHPFVQLGRKSHLMGALHLRNPFAEDINYVGTLEVCDSLNDWDSE